jgi:hypothetical protein
MSMWWDKPRRIGYRSVFGDDRVLDIVARAFAVVEVGGISGSGPARGRQFEQIFYDLCDRRGVRLSERAGARTVAGQTSASGLHHEVDGATRSVTCLTHWELKHLSTPVPKNELMIFNGKGLDFLHGSAAPVARTPVFRFLLSGGDVRDECRALAILWGISVIEPRRLPLALLCEAVARGGEDFLSRAEVEAVQYRALWGCRSLQDAIAGLSRWISGEVQLGGYGPTATLQAKEILDIQEQLGRSILDWLDEESPDWIEDAAEQTWNLVGGW